MEKNFVKSAIGLLVTIVLAAVVIDYGIREVSVTGTGSWQGRALAEQGSISAESLHPSMEPEGEEIQEEQRGSSMGSVPYFRDDAGKNTQLVDGWIYGYWNNRLCRYDPETLEETVLYETVSSQHGDFCIREGYVYFMVIPNVTFVDKTIGYLYRVPCDGSEEAVCLTDIVMPGQKECSKYYEHYTLDIYDDILYLVGWQNDEENQYFRLNQDGSVTPVPEEETLYGKMPPGYSSWRAVGQIITMPYAMRNYGYIFCRDDDSKISIRMDIDSLETEVINIQDEFYRNVAVTNNAVYVAGYQGVWYKISLDDISHVEELENVSGYLAAFWNEEGIYPLRYDMDWSKLSFIDQSNKVDPQPLIFERDWASEIDFFDGKYYYYIVTPYRTSEVRRRELGEQDEPERVTDFCRYPGEGISAGETCQYCWKDEYGYINIDYTIHKVYFMDETEAFRKINTFLDDLYQDEISYIEDQKELFMENDHESEYYELHADYAYRTDTASVNYADEDYVGICVVWEENGSRFGVHGMDGKVYYVFDRHTGEQVHITNFLNRSPEEICAIAAPYVEVVAMHKPREEDWEKIILEEGRFYLSEEGIGIHFDAYEIDCYAAGNQEVIVPYSAFDLAVDN